MKLSPAAPASAAGTVAIRRTRRSARPQSRSAAARRSGRRRGSTEPRVAPEVDDDGDQRAEVKRDVERLVEVRIVLEVVPGQRPRARGSGDPTRRPGATPSRLGRFRARAPASPRAGRGSPLLATPRARGATSEGGGGDRDDCLPLRRTAREYGECVSVERTVEPTRIAAASGSEHLSVAVHPFHRRLHKLEDSLWKC